MTCKYVFFSENNLHILMYLLFCYRSRRSSMSPTFPYSPSPMAIRSQNASRRSSMDESVWRQITAFTPKSIRTTLSSSIYFQRFEFIQLPTHTTQRWHSRKHKRTTDRIYSRKQTFTAQRHQSGFRLIFWFRFRTTSHPLPLPVWY